jgi:disulfide bond formation protein DsbB
MIETAGRGWLSRRMINGYCALLCGGLLGFALFAEHAMGYEPCPLCILQRIAVLALGFVFLAAYAHNPGRTGARVYGVLAIIAAGSGLALAWRQVWLQGLPADQVPACGPGYDYIMDVFPLHEALSMIFEGSGDCAEMGWTFLGLSMAGWVLVWMAAFALVAAWNNFRR